MEQLGLDARKGLSSPGVDDDDKPEAGDEDLLTGADVTLFRGLAARCSYLSMDRADIQFGAKEICREMSKPNRGSLRRLTRLARYLISRPRLVLNFRYQDWPSKLVINVDADWAGCRRTRKSTSGGSAKWGRHVIKTWSKTQNRVAKSSAETELYGCIRGSCEGMGLQSLFRDFGTKVDILVLLDANAARGIIERKGLCKVRHIDTDHLWLQQAQARRILPLQKVLGTSNVADLMAKHLGETDICKYIQMLDMEFTSGRSAAAAQLHELRPGKVPGDSWDEVGKRGRWRRHHSTWRRALFTPMKVANGPSHGSDLCSRRITEGVRRDGSKFKIVDSWKDGRSSHRLLPFEWIGHSTFIMNSFVGHLSRRDTLKSVNKGYMAETDFGDVDVGNCESPDHMIMQSTDTKRRTPTHPDTPACMNLKQAIGDLGKGKGEGCSTTAAAIDNAGKGQVSRRCSGGNSEDIDNGKQKQATPIKNEQGDDMKYAVKKGDGPEGEIAGKERHRCSWADVVDDSDGCVGEFRWV